jgi:aspartate 1-decarboxylase
MQRFFLRAKIHRVTVTGAYPDYEGSITIDATLLRLAGMAPFEQVHVYDVTNGQRFVTYIIEGRPDSGEIVVNGAAARLVEVGHLLIVASYCILDDHESPGWQPSVVLVNERNHPRHPAP